MAKLIKRADGSIGFEYERGTAERASIDAKKQSLANAQSIKKSKIDFKSLSQADKDALLEHLLRMHDLI